MIKAIDKLPGEKKADRKDCQKNHAGKEKVKIVVNSPFGARVIQ